MISGAAGLTTAAGSTMPAILLEPVAVTQRNLDEVVTSGWMTREALCAGVAAGTLAACS
jgi:D-xylose transport system substrate-binding protein